MCRHGAASLLYVKRTGTHGPRDDAATAERSRLASENRQLRLDLEQTRRALRSAEEQRQGNGDRNVERAEARLDNLQQRYADLTRQVSAMRVPRLRDMAPSFTEEESTNYDNALSAHRQRRPVPAPSSQQAAPRRSASSADSQDRRLGLTSIDSQSDNS